MVLKMAWNGKPNKKITSLQVDIKQDINVLIHVYSNSNVNRLQTLWTDNTYFLCFKHGTVTDTQREKNSSSRRAPINRWTGGHMLPNSSSRSYAVDKNSKKKKKKKVGYI